MSLREQFEEWVTQYPRNRSSARIRSHPSVLGSVSEVYADNEVELAWQAYQAGYAVSGRDELMEVVEQSIRDCGNYKIDPFRLIENVREAMKKVKVEA